MVRENLTITQSPALPVVQGAYKWITEKKRSGSEICLEVTEFEGPDEYYFVSYSVNEVVLPSSRDLWDWLRFQKLLSEWVGERDSTASVTEMVMCPAYQKIMAMGDRAIPLILAQMKAEGDEPDHWFWALRALTDIDPVADEDRGDVAQMAKAWLRWGETEGHAR